MYWPVSLFALLLLWYTRWQISRIIHGPEFRQRYRAALEKAQGRLAEKVVETRGSRLIR